MLKKLLTVVTCSPNPDPFGMRVFEPLMGQEILDECKSQETSFAGSDYLGVA